MLIGPVFSRELVRAPRRRQLFVSRTLYSAVLFGVACTAWLVLAGTQAVRGVGELARFGVLLFQLLAPLHIAVMCFIAAMSAASAVAQEKDRRTLVLLLMTRLTNRELVLGRLLASLIHVLSMLLAALPVFAILILLGGIALGQVMRVFLVTAVTMLAAGSIGSTIALWRDKTFQTLALVTLALVFWFAVGEVLASLPRDWGVAGWDGPALAAAATPLRSVLAATQPRYGLEGATGDEPFAAYCLTGLVIAGLVNAVAIRRVRVWNSSPEVQRQPRLAERGTQDAGALLETIMPYEKVPRRGENRADQVAAPGGQHIDTRTSTLQKQAYRTVWTNPIVWREVRTWAYGRKVILIRVVYAAFFVMALTATISLAQRGEKWQTVPMREGTLPAAARTVIPLFVLSLVIINATAVTSVTTERDGHTLDLILVTDLTPAEFFFGKLGGIFWNSKEMILGPLLLAVYTWWQGWLSLENLGYVTGGFVVMVLFVATLGIHCGMIYADSQTAIGISLGTVFFLFLGIATCIVMIISFSGTFHGQLAPFLAFIIGGAVGLFAALGYRNPSTALLASSLLLPFATFYAITSFLLNASLAVFLVVTAAYGFATAAMMVPALAEFDFAMGRTREVEE